MMTYCNCILLTILFVTSIEILWSLEPYCRRIYTEEKAKVVAAVWGTDFIPFLAILHQDDAKKRMNYTRMI